MKSLSGVVSLPPTPLTRKGEVDTEDLKKLIDYQFENSCDGVGVLAGIGEGYLARAHMKWAYRSCSMLQQLADMTGDKLFRFCGADSWTLRYILLGCQGIMTATAAVLPSENVELLRLVKAKKIREAREYWYEKFLPWNDSGFYENWQWAHKYALKLMGVMKTDEMAAPQAKGADYQKAEIEALLKHLGKI